MKSVLIQNFKTANAKNGNLNISVTSYDGNPNLLKYFFNQVKSISNIYKWSPEDTTTFSKIKLSGPALEFVINNPELENSVNIDLYVSEVNSSRLTQKRQHYWYLITLLFFDMKASKNLSHRLNRLAAIIHDDIDSLAALNIIKFYKLISALPSQLRVKINEDNVTDYKLAVDRAQTLQNITIGKNLLI